MGVGVGSEEMGPLPPHSGDPSAIQGRVPPGLTSQSQLQSVEKQESVSLGGNPHHPERGGPQNKVLRQ